MERLENNMRLLMDKVEKIDLKVEETNEKVNHVLNLVNNYQGIVSSNDLNQTTQIVSIDTAIQEIPKTPTKFKIIEKNARKIKLSWRSPNNGNSNLTKYLIEYKPTYGTWTVDINTVLVSGEDTYCDVSNLKPDTSYHFRIVAQNDVGSSEPSETLTVVTSEEAPSGPPVDVRISPIGQHALKVEWKPPLKEHWNGKLLGYYLGFKKENNDKPYIFEAVEYIKEQSEMTISNLEMFTEYGIVVQAFNKIGQGTLSDVVTEFTSVGVTTTPPEDVTTPAFERPAFPPKVIITSHTTESISLKVTPNVDEVAPIHGYVVHYKPEFSDDDGTKEEIGFNGEEYTIHRLKCGIRYRLYAVAYNK